MGKEKRTSCKRCVELERMLQEAREEVRYYQSIAEEVGRRHLREVDQLSSLIAERRRVEEALRESELRFRTLFDSSPQPIAVTDLETGRLIEVNDAFCQLAKYAREELLGRSTTESNFYSPQERAKLVERLKASGKIFGLEVNFKDREGSLLQALVFATLIRIQHETVILTILFDITEQRKLEAQLQHAQKMEAIGTLAGGIAHDFNNLLTAIQGNVSLALYDLDSFHPLYKRLRSIEERVRSGARLTAQLLGYARKGKYEVKPANLNHLLRETAETFGRTRKEITIHMDLEEDLLAAEVDHGQIEQVLLNLYVNAADAMPGGGHLLLTTMNATHRDIKGKMYEPKRGRYVLLKVVDTGKGMDERTLGRIFEPFFTTKEMGRGTGLGLASAYGIVRGHGGYIEVESEVGRGTTFSIFLPATDKKAHQRARNSVELVGGTGNILMVDDEDMVLKVGIDMLRRLGYEVCEARGGRQAVQVYRKIKDKVDLVILDMIMPDMGGGEAYDLMKEINPRLKVLLSSGYSLDGEAKEIMDRGCDGFIQKPFDINELSWKIKEILAN